MLHSKNEEDRIIHKHVERALRELETALGLVHSLERKGSFSPSRIREIQRDVRLASLTLRRVGTLGPPTEQETPMPKKKERKVPETTNE